MKYEKILPGLAGTIALSGCSNDSEEMEQTGE